MELCYLQARNIRDLVVQVNKKISEQSLKREDIFKLTKEGEMLVLLYFKNK